MTAIHKMKKVFKGLSLYEVSVRGKARCKQLLCKGQEGRVCCTVCLSCVCLCLCARFGVHACALMLACVFVCMLVYVCEHVCVIVYVSMYVH